MIKYFVSFIVLVFFFQSCTEPKQNYDYIFEELKNNYELQKLFKKSESSDYTKSLTDLIFFRQEYQKCDKEYRRLFENTINVDSTLLESSSLIIDEIIFDSFINLFNGININIDSLTRVYEIRYLYREELGIRGTREDSAVMKELIVKNDSRCMVGDTLDLFFMVDEDEKIRIFDCFLPPTHLFSKQVYLKVILLEKEPYYDRDIPQIIGVSQLDDVLFKCKVIKMNFPFIGQNWERLKERDIFSFSLKDYCHLIK